MPFGVYPLLEIWQERWSVLDFVQDHRRRVEIQESARI
jgi:hypothetical protein